MQMSNVNMAADPIPELTITDTIRGAFDEVMNMEKDNGLKERCKLALEQSKDGDAIPVNLIRDVYKHLKSNGKKVYLHELVEGADLITRPVELPPRNPELEARVQRLKIEEENREYRRMTQNVDPKRKNEKFSFQSEVKSMNRQLTSVINFLVTVAAGFAFGYKVVEFTYGKTFPLQMMAGLAVGTVIFFVDLYFMVRYTPI